MVGFCKGDRQTFKVLAIRLALELDLPIGRVWSLRLAIIKSLKYSQVVIVREFVRAFRHGFYFSEKWRMYGVAIIDFLISI